MRAWGWGLAALVGLSGCDVLQASATAAGGAATGGAATGATTAGAAGGAGVSVILGQPLRRFACGARPGAASYQVVVSADRTGTSWVAASAFTSETSLPLTALAWREGHPLAERAYFWVLRAYDRPDPQGVLLATSEPREFRPDVRLAPAWVLVDP